MNGIHIVVHAAALKQVPTCEYNPIEAVRTILTVAARFLGGTKSLSLVLTDTAQPSIDRQSG
jgi:hypothetical protein